MSKVTAQSNQSMMDVVLTGNGSMEQAMAWCALNGVSISDMPEPGTEYDNVTETTGGAAVLRYYAQNGIVPGTLAAELEPAGLVMTVVLRPVMDVVFVQDLLASGYDLEWSEGDGFVHVNALGTWATAPVYLSNLKSAHDAGTPPSSENAAVYDMPGKELSYTYISSIVTTEQLLWYADSTDLTALYVDSEGNEAMYAPFVYYDVDTDESYMLCGTLGVEQVAATSETVTVRCAIGNTSMVGVVDYGIARYYLRKRVAGVLVPIATVSAGTYDVELPVGNHELVLEVVYATLGIGLSASVISTFVSINVNIG
jgi:hypothetical protein